MFWLFLIIGSVTFLSVAFRLASDLMLRQQILGGRATAAELVTHLGLDSLDELDALRRREPTLLKVIPGPAGPYELVEFSFSPRRIRLYRRFDLLTRLQSVPVHAVILILVVAAMLLSHERVGGWVALLTAVFLELPRWALPRALGRSHRPAPSATTTVTVTAPAQAAPPASAPEPAEPAVAESAETAPAPADDAAPPTTESPAPVEAAGDPPIDVADADGATEPPPESIAESPAAPVGPLRWFTTHVLLSAAWRPVPDVVLASLRRAGQRDARRSTADAEDNAAIIDVGSIRLEIVLVSDPVDRQAIIDAAAQSWDWPEAGDTVAGHAARLVLTTRSPDDVPRAEVVRLHHRAQAALTEFAPALAAHWPDAGRLVPADRLAERAEQAAEAPIPASVCITFRTFPVDASEGGGVVSDTVGLHAFGLPDLEVRTEGEPAEPVAAALYEIAGRLFMGGCTIEPGEAVTLDNGATWRTARDRATFPPQRDVIRLDPAPDA